MDSVRQLLKNQVFVVWTTALVWCLGIVYLGAYAQARLQLSGPGVIKTLPVHSWIKGFAAYDGGWYYGLALHGYPLKASAADVFYPLFPMLLSVGKFLHTDIVLFGVLLNVLLASIAAIFLYLIARDHFADQSMAKQSLWWFLFFPTAFFLLMLYTEALFCALTFAAFYFARTRRWWAACICLAFVTATRLPGLAVAFAVAVEYLASRRYGRRVRLDRQAWWFALAPLGFVGYAAFLYVRYHDPLMMLHAYSFGAWPYQHFDPNIFDALWAQAKSILGNLHGFQEPLMAPLMWVVAVALTLYGAKKLPVSYTCYSLISLYIMVINRNFISVNRYLLPLFPMYLALTHFTKQKRVPNGLVLGLSGALMGFWLVLFVNGYWVA